ncbi:MAG: peptide chain release factor N(5)-glutamine methyltransferase [Flavobacteriales bacterium]|jgi:release factor glutamine methyltransferase|tara:strand:- start:280 stop:1164 length:885 start_codon:yes stop_codon:yes gene_type:complete
MIVKQYRNYFNETLKTIYPITEIDSFFFLLLEEYLGFRRVDIVLKSDFKITQETLNLLQSATKQLEQEVPLQYIIGKTEFYGLPFVVNKHVLIPRPETEELVAWVVSESSRFKTFNTSTKQTTETKQLKILDIGTGSGCIPISLKKQLPFAKISAIDISKEALTVAKKNAVLNNVDIHFILQDILKTVALDQHYDIIISNPPYVRELEKKELKNNVLKNEPHVALFVENDNPLIFYAKIAELAKKYLNKNGLLFFEINQYLGTETIDLVNKKGLKNIQLKKDMFGNDRIIVASK